MSVDYCNSEISQRCPLDKDNVCEEDTIEDFELEAGLDDAIFHDDKKEFISLIRHNMSVFHQRGQEFLVKACQFRAFECALALVKGETPVAVDVNGPACKMFPIHHAVKNGYPSTTEFLLHYGAHANIRSDVRPVCWGPQRGPKLPLYIPLYRLSRNETIKEWTPENSVFKLLTSICLPRFQLILETVGLLAWNTNNKEIEEEILQYARDGQLVHIAALLVVARKKLMKPMGTIIKPLLSLDCDGTISEDEKEALFLLFEVFERAGEAIEAYVKQEKFSVNVPQTIEEVACLLQRSGFALKRADIDLTCSTWFHRSGDNNRECIITQDEDSDLPHYGKSGYRWMTYAKPNNHQQILGEEVVSQQKSCEKDDGQQLLKEKLDQSLVNDDRDEFLSIIHQDKSLFQLKGQEILEKVCRYCALKCAEALLKEETPVVVCVNGRTSDKMFPIHHAAKTCNPSITELLLYYGARSNARADVRHACHPSHLHGDPMPCFRQRLPLYLTLYQMSRDDAIRTWNPNLNPGHSVFQLLTAICLPRFQNHLETLEMLTWSTKDKEIEREFLQCARNVELEHMAALLVVAHKKLTNPIEIIQKSIYSLGGNGRIRDRKKEAISLLLDLFVRAGDAIEAYVKQGKTGVTLHQTCEDVVCLLQDSGLNVERADTDLSGFLWFRLDKSDKREWRSEPVDNGMPHYGKSGYRWTRYDKPRTALLGRKVIYQQKIGEQLPRRFQTQAGVDAETKDQVGGVVSTSVLGTGVLGRAMGKLLGEASNCGVMRNVLPMHFSAFLASLRRGLTKRMM